MYSPKKLLFGQNKYIWDNVEGEKHSQRWKTVICNLCICVRAKEITAIRLFPTLSVDAVNQRIVSRPIPTQVKCKIPGIQRWGSARDANVPSPRPPESWLLISSHRISAAEAPIMAGMANRAYWSRGRPYTTCMCRHCCRWCSALAVWPSRLANTTDNNLSTRCALSS